jgi:predicted transcriptional regulator
MVGFINKLTQSNLVNKIESDGKITFVITEKGRIYLGEYKKFSNIAETFGLEL